MSENSEKARKFFKGRDQKIIDALRARVTALEEERRRAGALWVKVCPGGVLQAGSAVDELDALLAGEPGLVFKESGEPGMPSVLAGEESEPERFGARLTREVEKGTERYCEPEPLPEGGPLSVACALNPEAAEAYIAKLEGEPDQDPRIMRNVRERLGLSEPEEAVREPELCGEPFNHAGFEGYACRKPPHDDDAHEFLPEPTEGVSDGE
jgi:hypothetical protein